MRIILICLAIVSIAYSCDNALEKEEGSIAKTEVSMDESTKESQKTLDIANAFMEAMGKGDMEAMQGLMHEDMVWQNAGDRRLPWIGPWVGKKAILEEFLPAFGENFVTKKWEPTDSFAQGNTAAYFGQMIGLLPHSNQATKEFTYALRVQVKDGKVILWNWFEDSFEVSETYHK